MKTNRIGTDKNLQSGGTYDLLMVKIDGVFPEGQISFGLYDVPMKITGLQKVAQHFLRVLLTGKGSDPFYPNKGTSFPLLNVGSNITESSQEIIADIKESISDAVKQTRAMLNPNNEDKESALDDVQLSGVTATEEGWIIVLYLITLAGEGAEVAVPFPAFGIEKPVSYEGFVIPDAPPPVIASFTVNPNSGAAPLSVLFTDTSSGNPNTWLWNFGDGNTSALQSPVHIYSAANTYDVTLTVSGSHGSDTLTKTAAVTVTDPYAAYTGLLFHFDGSVADSSSNNISATLVNSAFINTTTVKFGTGALATTTASNSRLVTANVAPLQLTGLCTIEFWVNFTDVSAGQYFVTSNYSGGNRFCWFYTDGAGTLNVYFLGTTFATSATVTTNNWIHVAVTWDGTTRRFFKNGSLISQDTTIPNFQNAPLGWSIGGPDPSIAGVVGNPVKYIDEFRVTYGAARYTAPFTPSSTPF